MEKVVHFDVFFPLCLEILSTAQDGAGESGKN
jgi:hypothetical protein